MTAHLPGSDYARVYLPYGKRAHLKAPYNTMAVLCERTPGWRGEWHGTGSQEEHDHAASLPLCPRCQNALSTTLTSSSPIDPAVSTPAGPAASTVPPRGAAATPGAPSSPRDGVPGTSPPLPGLAQGGGEAPASGRDAWKAAIAKHNAAKRTRRATRAAPPIVGVRAVLRPRGERR